MKSIHTLLILSALALTAMTTTNPASAAPNPALARTRARPKLILLLVIDQFRADYLMRFQSRFKPALKGGEVGGFNYLMSKGAYYPYGEYDILQSMTGPGHATISTGAYPYQMGIPQNHLWNYRNNTYIYCTEDEASHAVGGADKPHKGTSPKLLIGSTFGDELKNAGYPSRVISLALKDRAAILMGGHRADLALWFDNDSFSWMSSTFYLPDKKLPDWVTSLNQELAATKGQTVKWEAGAETGYADQAPSMLFQDNWMKMLGSEFPHVQKKGSASSLNAPLGLEVTARAAEKALEAYKLGRGKSTDVLAVSFSPHDYVGHAFGPSSPEMEEMTVADDAAVSRVLNAARKSVPGGLDNVVVVLTGDHGSNWNPTWLKAHGMDSERIDVEDQTKRIEAMLEKKHGKLSEKLGKWVPFSVEMSYFLNHLAMQEKGLDPTLVENEVRDLLKEEPSAAQVFTATDVRLRRLPPGMHERQILKTYFPGRSADVILIPKPFHVAGGNTTDHMTGYAYDRMVPIILSGFGIRPGVHAEKAEVIDIAPTLTFLSGSLPPALTEGRVLSEALTPQ